MARVTRRIDAPWDPQGAGMLAPAQGLTGRDPVRVTIEGSPPLVADLVPEPGLRSAAAAAVCPLPPGRDQLSGARRVEVVVDGWRFEATVEPARRAILRERARRHATGAGGGQQVVRAALPGRILRVWVAPGDQVESGSRLCSLEAMKMENEVLAHRAGTILRVSVAPGVRVEQGDELVVIA